jgi:hypothetical protein
MNNCEIFLFYRSKEKFILLPALIWKLMLNAVTQGRSRTPKRTTLSDCTYSSPCYHPRRKFLLHYREEVLWIYFFLCKKCVDLRMGLYYCGEHRYGEPPVYQEGSRQFG